MKARRIIARNACLTMHELKSGGNYRCEKIDGVKIDADNFWSEAVIWVWESDFELDGVGRFREGRIAAIVKGVLFPSVKFDENFRFYELPQKKIEIAATRCRNKICEFVRNI